MTDTNHEDFNAERAKLNDELTKTALLGGDTKKVRERLTSLGAREQAEREAQQAAITEARKQLEADAVRTASAMATDMVLRLEDAGFAASNGDAEHIAILAAAVARHDVEIALASAERDAAYGVATAYATRIQLLSDRAAALQQLRLTEQSGARDLIEADAIARDLETLGAAYKAAYAVAIASHVPANLLKQKQDAMAQFAKFEGEVRKRILWERARAAEVAYLNSIREVCTEAGARGPAGLYVRSQEFDRFLRTNQL
jgi:hypothetical protein